MKEWFRRRTLRWRITALATAVTLACLLGLALVAGRGLPSLLTSSVDDSLGRVLQTASSQVRAGSTATEPNGVEVRVLDTAGAPVGGGRPELPRRDVRELKAGTPVWADGDPPVRWHGTVVSDPAGNQRLVVVGAGMVGHAETGADGARWLLVAASAGAVVAGVAIWLAVGSALSPVARMRRSVHTLGQGERLEDGAAARELRELAAEFNLLLDRQEAAAERLRRFTGDAAHELRSPVASIRVQSEVAAANPDAELSHEVHVDVLADTERLTSLLDGLLALARSDAGELPPAEPVDLVSEARAAVERRSDQPVSLVVNAATPQVWARAAHAEVQLVLDNLLRNACRYARAQVVVSVLVSRSVARIVVDDDGPGVPAEHRARVFDRFYRVGDDRARDSGGAGLGLALVAELLRRRGGKVAVGESPDGGARFQAAWPVSPQ